MNMKMIASMFEDLKKVIRDNRTSNNGTATPSLSAEISNLDHEIKIQGTSLLKIVGYIMKHDKTISEKLEHLENADNRRAGEVSNCLKTFVDTAHSIDEKLDKPLKINHSVDKSSKVVVALVVLSIFSIASSIWNVFQLLENNDLMDNDIKYRYVKAMNGIDSDVLYRLETIFEYEDNTEQQEEIRYNVEEFEREAKERAEELERARLKEKQANQLMEEAEKIKKKK